MTAAPTYADLERRYNGPIPQEALDRLRHGSATKAEIARVEDSIAFFHGEKTRAERSARRWLERGNVEMHDRNLADVELYKREWRKLRARLKDLRGTDAAVKGAGRFFDVLDPREPGDG